MTQYSIPRSLGTGGGMTKRRLIPSELSKKSVLFLFRAFAIAKSLSVSVLEIDSLSLNLFWAFFGSR